MLNTYLAGSIIRGVNAISKVIVVNRAYIAIAGGLVEGAILSTIINAFYRDGDTSGLVSRDEKLWFARKRTDWWEDVGVTGRQVDRAVTNLVNAGLVKVVSYKLDGVPVPHFRLDDRAISTAMKQVFNGEPPNPKAEDREIVEAPAPTADQLLEQLGAMIRKPEPAQVYAGSGRTAGRKK